MTRHRLRSLALPAVAVLGLGVLAACGGDDPPRAATLPTTGPLTAAPPDVLAREATERLRRRPHIVNVSIAVSVSADDDAPEEVRKAAEEVGVEIDARVEAENPRRRTIRVSVTRRAPVSSEVETFTVVEYDGRAYLSVDDRGYRVVAPALVARLAGTRPAVMPVTLPAGPVATSPGERFGEAVRTYTAAVDPGLLGRDGRAFGGGPVTAATAVTDASVSVDLSEATGDLRAQQLRAEARLDLARVREDLSGTVRARLFAGAYVVEQGTPVTVEEPRPEGPPVRTPDDLERFLLTA